MVIPNLFIVGAPKAGTTALHTYLSSHPDIGMSSVKEPYFFGPAKGNVRSLAIKDPEKYYGLFAGFGDKKVVGESSAIYLYSEQAAREIHGLESHPKIVISLRDPVRRAYSHYLMARDKYGIENLPFETAVTDERGPADYLGLPMNPYVGPSLYSCSVGRYLDLFGPDRVKILVFEEFMKDVDAGLEDLFDFLEVSVLLPEAVAKENRYVEPRARVFRKLVYSAATRPLRQLLSGQSKKWLRERVFFRPAEYEQLDDNVYMELWTRLFAEDVAKLEETLGRTMDAWGPTKAAAHDA